MATSYIRAANPIWYFVDLVGLGLNDEYYMFTLENVFPYLPQAVYHDADATVPYNNPIQFYPNGTLPPDLYWNEAAVYRIEIRRGPDQSYPLIYEINDFIPNGEDNASGSRALATDNQISNPQFAFINFESPLTITSAGTYEIAPDWNLTLTGAGTATITQEVYQQDTNEINDPQYGIRIATTGWTTAFLTQTFQKVGSLWASVDNSALSQDGYVSMSLIARAQTLPYNVTLLYTPDPTASPYPVEVVSGVITTGRYQVLAGSAMLDIPTDTTLNSASTISFTITLQGTGTIDISCVQLIGQTVAAGTTAPDPVTFQQETRERALDHLFHYYANSLIVLPKNSILTGWNFPLNPKQFTFSGAPNISGTTPVYVADQTIVTSNAASSISAQFSTSPAGFLSIKPQAAADQGNVALIQYIDSSTAADYWGYNLSVLIRARIKTVVGTGIKVKVRLINYAGNPPTLSSVNPIASWAANGDPVFAAGWTVKTPENDPAYTLENNYDLTEFGPLCPPIAFNKIPAGSSLIAATMALVVYTVNPMIKNSADELLFQSISLVPNDFAVDATPQTFDQSLRQCQFYYEKSYSLSDPVGTITPDGSVVLIARLDDSGEFAYKRSFGVAYKEVKRGNATVRFWSPASATAGNLQFFILNNGTPVAASSANPLEVAASGWTQTSATTTGIFMACQNTGAAIAATAPNASNEAIIKYHYEADARLGL